MGRKGERGFDMEILKSEKRMNGKDWGRDLWSKGEGS